MTDASQSPPPGSFAKLMGSNQALRKKKSTARRSGPDKPASQLAGKPASEPASQDEIGPVVERGRMFYITQKVDHWLDQTVSRLRERGVYKADRSVVVNAILHDPGLYEIASLSELEKGVLRHLANKYQCKSRRAS
jgi:hypothetical protein